MLKVSNGVVTLTRGDTARLSVDLTGEDGTAYEMAAGDTLALTVKRSTADADALISKESKGSSAFVLDPSDTSGLAYGRYRYDVQLTTAGGDVCTVCGPSAFVVGEEVTW